MTGESWSTMYNYTYDAISYENGTNWQWYVCVLMCTAVGCPDVMTSQHMWATRSGDELIAGCVTSQVTWTLTCVANWWQGVSSNCSVGQ